MNHRSAYINVILYQRPVIANFLLVLSSRWTTVMEISAVAMRSRAYNNHNMQYYGLFLP